MTMPTATIGGIQIYYEDYGKGPTLIMILGLGQDVATWGFQIAELSKHVRLIVFDNRDSGQSSRCSDVRLIVFDNRDSGQSSRCSDNYTTETMAQDILGLMDYLEIKEAHLLGTSMGGMIAQHVALMAPARLNSLILAGTTSWGEA
jgi:3-oxoadipate enol-lactonase